jgi:hypothetical protein
MLMGCFYYRQGKELLIILIKKIVMAHRLQNVWLTSNQLEEVKKEFYTNFPHLKKAKYVNKPDDGLFNVFSLEIKDGQDLIYYRLDGSKYSTASEIWEIEKRLDY